MFARESSISTATTRSFRLRRRLVTLREVGGGVSAVLRAQVAARSLVTLSKTDFELLGATTMSNQRAVGPKETQRVDACLTTVRLLSYIRLPFARYMNAVRCML